jgi:hypothetical protein
VWPASVFKFFTAGIRPVWRPRALVAYTLPVWHLLTCVVYLYLAYVAPGSKQRGVL